MRKETELTIQNIKASAKVLFVKDGYEKASMRKIAQGANITAGALYKFFADKDALFHAIFDEIAEQLFYHEFSLLPNDLSALSDEALLQLFDAHISEQMLDYLLPQLPVIHMLLTNGNPNYFHTLKQQYITSWSQFAYSYYKELYDRGLAKNILTMDEIQILEESMFSTICSFIASIHPQCMPTKEAFIPYKTYFHVLISGIKATLGL